MAIIALAYLIGLLFATGNVTITKVLVAEGALFGA
jgi:hypothetical protein